MSGLWLILAMQTAVIAGMGGRYIWWNFMETHAWDLGPDFQAYRDFSEQVWKSSI